MMDGPAPVENADVINPPQALQNEYILQHLFSFLPLRDVKSCREVNKLWKKEGCKYQRRKGAVVFHFHRDGPAVEETKAKLMEIANYCQSNKNDINYTPMCTFKFIGQISIPLLQSFVEKANSHVENLFIIPGMTSTEDSNKGFELNTIIGPNVKRFWFYFYKNFKTTPIQFTLYVDQTFFLQELYLNNCELKVVKYENRPSLKKLHLGSNNTYTCNGGKLSNVILNQFFDLRNTMELIVAGDGKLVIDFADCCNESIVRDRVKLRRMKAINWDKCDWKVNVLSMDGTPYIEKNCLQWKMLAIYETTVDLSLIHNLAMAKKLVLRNATILETPFFLPNLLELQLIGPKNLKDVSLFSNYTTIRTLHLAQYFNKSPMCRMVSVDDLPENVNELVLDKVYIALYGERGRYPLSTLKFISNKNVKAHYKLEQTLRKLKPNRLIYYDYSIRDQRNLEGLTKFIKHHLLYKDICHISIGKFSWNEDEMPFEGSEFSKLVDKKAEWYDFKQTHGKARFHGIGEFKLPSDKILWVS